MASFCEGKVAVVTGAGGTLCSCIAKDLALKGAKVVLIGRTREKLEKVAAEITVGSRSCATADAQERVPPPDRGFWDIDMEAFKSVLEINTLGTVIPSRIFGLQMAKAGGGSILNFGSMNTYRPLTRVAPYAMSKAAIANWTMFFAQYMAPAHVRVNAVAPGFFVNERSKQYLMTPDGGFSARGQQVIAHTPAGRFGEANELLGCVNWLLDDEKAGFVTGITVPVDGGFLASAGV